MVPVGAVLDTVHPVDHLILYKVNMMKEMGALLMFECLLMFNALFVHIMPCCTNWPRPCHVALYLLLPQDTDQLTLSFRSLVPVRCTQPLTACGVSRRVYMNGDPPDASTALHSYALRKTPPRFEVFLGLWDTCPSLHAVVVMPTFSARRGMLVESIDC